MPISKDHLPLIAKHIPLLRPSQMAQSFEVDVTSAVAVGEPSWREVSKWGYCGRLLGRDGMRERIGGLA